MSAAEAPEPSRTATGSSIAARLVLVLWWSVCALSLLLIILTIAFHLSARYDWYFGDSFQPWRTLTLEALGTVGAPILGALIVWDRPANRYGWAWCVFALAVAVRGAAFAYEIWAWYVAPIQPGGWEAAWLGTVMDTLTWGLVPLLLVLFPDGRPPSLRWRPVVWATLVVCGAWTLSTAVAPGPMVEGTPNPISWLYGTPAEIAKVLAIQLEWANLFLMAVGALSLLARLRHTHGRERQQVKWLAYVAVPLLASLVLQLKWHPIGLLGAVYFAAASWAVYIAIGIAVFRHRLYDIDRLLTRTLVYGLLTALATTVYLAIVVGIGTLVGSRGEPNLFLSLVATTLIAVAFQPARDRSRRLANRLVYGKRATPYEVLSGFSRSMASTSTDDSLLRMARLVVEATGAMQATVWLRLGEVLQPQASWPQAGPVPQPNAFEGRRVEQALAKMQPGSRTFPVEHEEELLGALTVTSSPREPLTPAGEKLIADLAAQTGLGLRFQRLKERALFARALASFLPPEVAELVEASPSALSLREELEATILFSDIRGFSSLAERLPPREVAEVVGRHLGAMVEVVTSHGGVLDKFAGDAVMAVFGAPRPTEDHAQRALACAVAMQRRQVALNNAAEQAGLPVFQIGIGVNTGTVIAGTLGGVGRLDYTVLGDAVNIAQRLQSEAGGGEILASALTVRQSGTDRAEPAGLKHLKGRQELVDTYRIRWANTPTATAQPSGETAHAE
jgi:class 3 adenylate cyclase